MKMPKLDTLEKEILESLGFVAVLLLVFTAVPSAVSATTVQQIGTSHNAVFLSGIEKNVTDSHGNRINIIGNAYLVYDSSGRPAAISYIFREYVSPSPLDRSWTLRESDTTHPTAVIDFSNPISAGRTSEFILNTATPSTIQKGKPEGTVTYTFGISATEGYQAEGAYVQVTENSYVTWQIPVYYYTYGPRTISFSEMQWWGSIAGDLQYARYFTAATSVEYQGIGEQSIYYYCEGNFQLHHWYGNDYSSLFTDGYLTTYISGGGGGGIPE